MGHGLYCGWTSDGRQFLMGPKDSRTACVVYSDGQGNYLGWHDRAPPAHRVPPPPAGPEAWGRYGANVLQAHFEMLRSELGCRLESIHVRAFSADDVDMSIGVHELPSYLQPLREDPHGEKRELGEAEFDRFRTMLAEWIRRGDYVLTWGGEYHVNKGGEIVFS
jgi:hypothetical protein